MKVLGASFDTPEDNRIFAEAQSFGFPLLCDVGGTVGRDYGVHRPADDPFPDWPRRMTYIIDPQGRVARAYKVTDAAAHPEEVLGDITALIQG